MPTRLSIIPLLVAAIAPCAVAQVAPSPDTLSGGSAEERLVSYLAERGMDDLLATHYRSRLAAAPPEERRALAEELGTLYARQLSAALDPGARQALESRCRDLLALIPDADSFDLRINLAKTTYLQAEEIAERDRLRLTSTQERDEAVRILSAISPAFKDIAVKVDHRMSTLDRAKDVAKEDKAEEMRIQIEEMRRLRSLARYYAGWADLYLATLTSKPSAAQSALEQFGWLLNATEGKPPTLERFPRSLVKYEHIARAAVGVALAHAAKGATSDAVRWLDAIESADNLAQAVADQIWIRRLTILGTGGNWPEAEGLLLRRRATGATGAAQTLSPAIARLMVVSAMEFRAGTGVLESAATSASRVAALAMGDLVTQGELAQVLDLVKRYGPSPLGEQGFVALYVRAVETYEHARSLHKLSGESTENPTPAQAIIEQYVLAAGRFAKAKATGDAPQFDAARSRATMLEGLSLYYAGRFASAVDRFKSLADADAPADQKRDALWHAVLAADRAAQAGDAPSKDERDRLAALYITSYPGTSNAAQLLMQKSGSALVSEERAAEILLSVAPDSSVFHAARRQAARLLYSAYRRASTGKERDFAAQRFAAVAEEVLAAEMERSVADVTSATARESALIAVLYARQIADAMLSITSPDIPRAESALANLDRVAALHTLDLKESAGEIGFRRLQIALARGDDAAAASWIQKLGGDTSEYPRAADRLIYRRALDAFTGTGKIQQARQVVTSGLKVIKQFEADKKPLSDPAVASVHDAVARAAGTIASAENDAAMRDLAVKTDKALLAAGIKTQDVLRRLALQAEAAADKNTALSCWRELSAALPPGQLSWCEARFNAIRLLADADPAAARDALSQHKALYPSFGPDPWGSKLRDLDASLAPPSPLPAPKPSNGSPAR